MYMYMYAYIHFPHGIWVPTCSFCTGKLILPTTMYRLVECDDFNTSHIDFYFYSLIPCEKTSVFHVKVQNTSCEIAPVPIPYLWFSPRLLRSFNHDHASFRIMVPPIKILEYYNFKMQEMDNINSLSLILWTRTSPYIVLT